MQTYGAIFGIREFRVLFGVGTVTMALMAALSLGSTFLLFGGLRRSAPNSLAVEAA